MPDADLVIELDAPEPVVVEKEPAPQPVVETKPAAVVPPVEDLKGQLAELTKTAERERGEKEAARAEAVRLAAEATQAKDALAKVHTDLAESNVSAVESAIAAAKAEADGYQRDQQAAFENGDYAKAADFGRKMAKAEAKIVRLEEGKDDLETLRAQPKKPEATPQPAAQADPFERVVASASPKAQTWLRAHPEFVKDEGKARKAQIAHLSAIDNGLTVDSDAYFDFCEQQLGLKAKPEPQPTTRTTSMPAAPVSRDATPSGGQTTPTQVSLTPGEQRNATDGTIVWNYNDPKVGAVKGQAIGLKEMARRKIALKAAGAYDRSYTDS